LDASRSFVQPANFEDRERDLIERIRREEERAKREQEIGETMLKREREVAIELQKSNEKSMQIKEETSQAMLKREREFVEIMLKREREMAIELQKSNEKSMEINEKSLDIYKEEVLHRRSLEHTQKSVEHALLLFGKANESNPETLQAFTPLLGSLLSRGPESK
jgi:hypothetical protein